MFSSFIRCFLRSVLASFTLSHCCCCLFFVCVHGKLFLVNKILLFWNDEIRDGSNSSDGGGGIKATEFLNSTNGLKIEKRLLRVSLMWVNVSECECLWYIFFIYFLFFARTYLRHLTTERIYSMLCVDNQIKVNEVCKEIDLLFSARFSFHVLLIPIPVSGSPWTVDILMFRELLESLVT